MTWPTHIASSVLFTAASLDAAGIPVSVPVLGIAALGGLAPDLDAHESKMKHLKIKWGRGKNRMVIKPFYVASEIISFFFGHRGLMHSLLAVFILLVLGI